MCLIAYVKAGSAIPETYFRSAAKDNDDGIGVMSADGVEKFLGRKMVKRAWRYVRELQSSNQEFAVHFRFATHGRVALVNTHPFRTPDGNAYVMHNGVLLQYASDRNQSDTQKLVELMIGVDVSGDTEYWNKLEEQIGWSNKLVVMSHDAQFRIVNVDAGDWIDGVWYSQTYSLPGMVPAWWAKYENEGSTTGNSVTNYVRDNSRSYYLDAAGKYHEIGFANGNSNHLTPMQLLLPYETRSAAAAYLRRDLKHADDCECGECVSAAYERVYGTMDSVNGAGTHSLPRGTYVTPVFDRSYRDDAALDAELERHFADSPADDDATDMCPSCECIHSEGRQCPECGFIDMSDGMLDQAQAG